MIILIPMGGHGSRFLEAGYTQNKACIPVTNRYTLKQEPMIVAALKDIPGSSDPNNKIICVDRDFHEKNGTEKEILSSFPNALFIHDHVLLDQAFGCFLAREFLDSEEELFVAACDCGFEMNVHEFNSLKKVSSAIMMSHTNDQNIEHNPYAHSWAIHSDLETCQIDGISIKTPVSEAPMNDHATTGMFWFKQSRDFLKALEKMIWQKDTHNGKYYVDKVLQYLIDDKKRVSFFDVKYISWGTPYDYEVYEKTVKYWSEFRKKEGLNEF